ncbi:hypothetical protein MELB17_18709 [Marinobacter sp. ELB17]|nr:hypothetical protein MELB17_18709 [Marinobacter sp. ELB17]
MGTAQDLAVSLTHNDVVHKMIKKRTGNVWLLNSETQGSRPSMRRIWAIRNTRHCKGALVLISALFE